MHITETSGESKNRSRKGDGFAMSSTIASVIVLVLILGVVFLLVAPVKMTIEFSQVNRKLNGKLQVRYLGGIISLTKKLFAVEAKPSDEGPMVQVVHDPTTRQGRPEKTALTTEEVFEILTHWQQWSELWHEMWSQMKRLLWRLHVQRLDLQTRVGTGDAILTGSAYGTVYGVITTLVGAFSFLSQFDTEPVIEVTADFYRPVVDVNAFCIVKVRAGYAILTGLRMALVWRRRNGSWIIQSKDS
jgi:hypothetical protein